MKTCFYCGRELAPGQRCSCRDGAGTNTSGQKGSSGSSAASSGSSTSSTASSGSSSSYSSAASGSSASSGTSSDHSETAYSSGSTSSPFGEPASSGKKRFTFASFITKVRSIFPSFSKLMRPVMTYVWHPVSTIQNRSQVVPVATMLIVNSLFAVLTSLMVIFTSATDSPFLGMLISLIFGKTDLFSEHPVTAFFIMSAILWLCVLILALCFTWTSRLVNRKMTFLRALDTVSISSIYMCFADALIFFSVLLGSRGAFTLIFVALVVMGICHFVSIKQDLVLRDDVAFNMLAVSYLLFYVLAQLAVTILIRIVVLVR